MGKHIDSGSEISYGKTGGLTLYDSIHKWYLDYIKSGKVELPLNAFIELERILSQFKEETIE